MPGFFIVFMIISTIVQQIVILAIIGTIGILAARTKILEENAKKVIENLVFYITLPLLIVTKLSSLDISDKLLVNGLYTIGLTYIILFIQIVIGLFSSKLFRLLPRKAIIHRLHTFLGNIVFLGFPLLDAIFPGGEAIFYAALYQLVMNTVFWTYGIYHLDSNSRGTGWNKRVDK